VTVVVPLAVLIDLAVRRQGRLLLETAAAAAVGLGLTTLFHWGLMTLASQELVHTMSARQNGQLVLTLPGYVAMLAALLTLAGPRSQRTTVRWSWNALWVAIGVTLITGQVSLPGVATALLLGRFAGLGVRYPAGVAPQRAYGDALVAGIRRAGYTPVSVVRVPDADTRNAAEQVHRAHNLPAPDAATAALVRSSNARVYQVRTAYGEVLDLRVLDGDRRMVGLLTRTWRSLRLRGIEGRRVVSLRQASERAALLAYAVTVAGVHTPRLLRISENADSMMLLQEHPAGALPLNEVDDEQLTDELLAEVWTQLRAAHHAGIAHRAITADTVLVGPDDGHHGVWLTGWDSGDVASSDLARRIDLTQMLAVLALRVGPERAVRSVANVLNDDDVAAIGPMLQTVTLPRQTRELMRKHKDVLAELRALIVARMPEANIEPQRMVRFGARTVLLIVVTVIAVGVILATFNVHEIGDALKSSDWRFSIVAFALGMAALGGSALTLVAFSPVKIPYWRSCVVQAAATFVALAAPAGIGPAALNLRALTKRGVKGALATATVALIQVAQMIMTILLLVVLMITSGSGKEGSPIPLSPTVLIVIGIVVVLIAASLLVPKVRTWVGTRVVPTLRQTWPRLVEVVGQPSRLTLGLAGNIITTLGYVLAFDAALRGLGQHATLIQVAVAYLVGTTVGALVPTPGGVGATEFALATGLGTVAGINYALAFPVAVLFRVLTYWLRIPIGWVAMRHLQKVGEL
ncbi:MAG: flippase-like domain-containing protein, partial [Micrococcales bacterium]|nr:flippase-like domain-containing protein [Micrococcales bacterium]